MASGAEPAGADAAGPPAPPDLDEFQARLGLDDRCVQGLRDLQPGDQLVLMDLIASKECSNASAFTWSQVRKFQVTPAALKLEYLRKHLDDRAFDGLGQLPLLAQEHVAMQVDVLKCRNLSAFAWKQIRTQQAAARSLPPPPPSLPPPLPSHFVYYAQACGSTASLDARARSRTPPFRTLAAMPPPHSPIPGGYALPPPPYSGVPAVALDGRACKAVNELEDEGRKVVLGLLEKGRATNPSAKAWSLVKRYKEKPVETKAEFIRASLDEGAAEGLERLDASQQEDIFEQVDVVRCRNISAFCWSKIKAATAGLPEPPPSPSQPRASARRPGPPAMPVSSPALGVSSGATAEDFGDDLIALSGLDLDERCTAALRELPRATQESILLSVEPTVRNPSAFVWARVKSAKAQSVDPIALSGLALDDRCVAALRALPVATQESILRSLEPDVRNPSAYVWSKVKSLMPPRPALR